MIFTHSFMRLHYAYGVHKNATELFLVEKCNTFLRILYCILYVTIKSLMNA